MGPNFKVVFVEKILVDLVNSAQNPLKKSTQWEMHFPNSHLESNFASCVLSNQNFKIFEPS